MKSMTAAEFFGVSGIRVTVKNGSKVGKAFVTICCNGLSYQQAYDRLLNWCANGLLIASDNGFLAMWHEVCKAYGASL